MRIKYIVIVLFVFVSHLLLGSELENLKQKLETLPLSKQLELLCDLHFDVLVSNNQELIPIIKNYIDIAKKEKKYDQVSKLYNKLSLAYYYNGKYDKNLEYGLKAIHLFDSLNNKSELGTMYGELGYQMKRRDLPQAFQLMQKGIGILERIQNPEPLAKIYDNYGVLHELNHCFDSALFFYNKALMIKKNLNDSLGIPFSLNNIFMIYLMSENFDSAFHYLDKSTKYRKKLQDQIGLAENYNYYGNTYVKINQPDRAISYYQKALQIAKQHNYTFLIKTLYNEISSCYENLSDFNNALVYHKLFTLYKDSLINIETNKTIAQLEIKYKTAEKEKEIEMKNLTIKTKSFQVLMLIITISLIIVSFVLIYTRYRQKQKQLLQQKLLEEKKHRLKSVIQAQDDERSRIARDLHDGIGQLLSAASMKNSLLVKKIKSIESIHDKEFDDTQNLLNTACEEVRSISHQMMPRTLKELGLNKAINDLLIKSLKKSNITYSFDNFGFDERIDKNKEIGVYRICQELINNAIKHAQCSEISVQLYTQKSFLILNFEDNGIGINSSKDKKGIGLQNIESRVEAMNGIFNIENGPENGTLITLKVPLQ